MEPLIPIQITMSTVLFSALGLAAAFDDAPPAAEKILSEFEAKTGGGPIGSKSLRVTGTVTVAGMPGGGTFEETFVGADRVKIFIEWPGMGSMTQGRAGDRAWSTDPALGVTVKE